MGQHSMFTFYCEIQLSKLDYIYITTSHLKFKCSKKLAGKYE